MVIFEREYVAIIGDIKNSKMLLERKEVQDRLNIVLEKINVKYKNDIASKFVITLGDEFQGLMFSGNNLVKIIEFIIREMYPIDIRFGVGIGEIYTDINPDISIGADGPGYHRARKAIENVKSNEHKKQTRMSDIRIELDESRQTSEKMFNTIFSLLTVIRNNWSDRQREIINELERNGGVQKECAKHLGITQSSVQKGLYAGAYYTYKAAIEELTEIFEEMED